MTDEIRPALSAEEWAKEIYSSSDGELSVEPHVGSGFGDLSVYLMDAGPLLDCECEKDGPYADAGRVLTPQDRHALAALALYGQAFGFTHEDVGLLRELAASAEWAADNANGGEGSAEAAVAISPLESLADRIEALLPPREEG